MRLPEAVIFDIDGVLAETEDLHRQAYNRVFEDLSLPIQWSVEDYRRMLHLTAGTKLAELGLDRHEPGYRQLLDHGYELKRNTYLALLHSTPLTPRPGVERLLTALRDSGVTIAAASTSASEAALAVMECLKGGRLREFFRAVCAGDAVPNRKPAPDIYLLAAEKIGASPSRCVAIEDSVHGLQAALAAGMKCVVTPCMYTHGDNFTGADLVVEDLEQGRVTPTTLAGLF